MSSVGTVENHGKKWQKTRHTFVKIAKITAKSWHFGKITAFTVFDDNHGFRDFRVSVIIYCP